MRLLCINLCLTEWCVGIAGTNHGVIRLADVCPTGQTTAYAWAKSKEDAHLDGWVGAMSFVHPRADGHHS